jgi:hypothetical protein
MALLSVLFATLVMSVAVGEVAAFKPTPKVKSPDDYEVPWIKVPPPTPIAPYDWTDDEAKGHCDDIVTKCRESDTRYRVCVGKEGCAVDGMGSTSTVEDKVVCHNAATKCHLFLSHCVSAAALQRALDCSNYFQ